VKGQGEKCGGERWGKNYKEIREKGEGGIGAKGIKSRKNTMRVKNTNEIMSR
jgi:hypothetical protein